MSSDIERPRQRTVAELLAEHGDAASSSRRRRRRSSDDENAGASATVGLTAAGSAIVTQRTPPAAETSYEPGYEGQEEGGDPGVTNDRIEAYRQLSRPVAPEHPTDVMPRVAGGAAPQQYDTGHEEWSVDDEATGPIPTVGAAEATTVTPAASTATALTAATSATAATPARPDADGGPPTQLARPVAPDGADGAADDAHEWDDDWSDDQWQDHDDERRPGAAPGTPEGPATGFYDVPAEEYGDPRAVADYADAEAYEELEARDAAGLAGDADGADDADTDGEEAEGRSPRSGPSWPAVIAQWIAGAIGGAALWVAFRYLWKGFPVVAVAAALLVTIGLVIVVRVLLHNRDLRTTVFAVLVGLLLTASPAVLVLIGR